MTDDRTDNVEDAREALRAVLASPAFTRSARMSRFLRHVVEAALSGEEGALKETSIGVAVFDRAPDYDPKVDPVVRNEARRLRATLERYYETDGASDAIRISIPKGGYRPRFDGRATTPDVNPHDAHVTVASAAVPAIAIPVQAPGHEPELASQPWLSRVHHPIAIGLVMVIIVIAAATGLAWLARGRTAGARGHTLEPRIQTLTTYREREIHPAVAPDSRRVAFSWDRDGNYDIYVKPVDEDVPVRLTSDAANDLHPAWSPDGREIAFARAAGDGFDIMVMPAQGGPERRVTRVEHLDMGSPLEEVLLMLGDPGPAWSHDSASLAVTGGGSTAGGQPLRLVSARTGAQERVLTTPPAGAYDFFPTFSPDGAWLAFGRQQSNSTSDLFIVPAAGGTERRVDFGIGDLRGIAWMPDGRSMIVSSNLAGAYRLWKVQLEGGAPELLPTAGRSAREPAVSPDGRWIVYSDATLQSEIWRARTALAGGAAGAGGATGASELLIGSTRQNHSAQYAPDGRSVAFVSDRSGSWEVWVSAADGTNAVQLTHFEGPLLGTVHWSPDSRFLAFDARPTGHSGIYLMSSGGGTARRVAENAFEEKMPFWSRDGAWLYFNSTRGGTQQLWKARRADGGEASRVSERFAMDSAESPDGSAIYFLGRGPGIWRTLPGGDAGDAALVPGLEQVVTRRLWSVSSSGIWFLDRTVDRHTIWLYRFATGRVERAGRVEDDIVVDVPGLSISPDERSMIYARQKDAQSDLWLMGTVAAAATATPRDATGR